MHQQPPQAPFGPKSRSISGQLLERSSSKRTFSSAGTWIDSSFKLGMQHLPFYALAPQATCSSLDKVFVQV
jgi:hypothetical protein